MVLSIIRESVAALGYLLLFGLGTIVGMMLITLILSAAFAFTAANLPKFNWRLRVASGLVSFVFGVVLIYGIGFAEGGLFTGAPTWHPRCPPAPGSRSPESRECAQVCLAVAP